MDSYNQLAWLAKGGISEGGLQESCWQQVSHTFQPSHAMVSYNQGACLAPGCS